VVYVVHITYNDTHLNILASKPKRVHVKGITPCSHNPSIQIRFKLYSVKGVQVIALSVRDQALSKYAVDVSRTDIIFVAVWQAQLLCHVLGDPLTQLLRKELQIGMVLPERILECLFVSVVGP
jgi:hypothetical protein